MSTRPDDDVPEYLRAQLRVELDSVPLLSPQPSQARFRSLGEAASGGWLRFGAGVAIAAVAVFLLGIAEGGVNPAVWKSRTAGAMQHLRNAVGPPAPSPKPTPSPGVHPATVGVPAGESSPEPEGTTGGSQETGDSPEPATEPSSEPTSESTPEASPTPGTEGGSGESATSSDPLPSPSPASDP